MCVHFRFKPILRIFHHSFPLTLEAWGTASGVMNHFPRTRGRGRLSFTSNASLPPSYQSNVSSTHSSAQGRSLGTSSPDTVSDISFGSEAALPGPRYGEVSIPVHYWCWDGSFLLSPSVYYCIYLPAGGVEVKNPEFPNDPYLGRALAIQLTPPHTIASVRHHICGRERITDHRNIRLFDNILSRTPLNDSKPVNILDRAGVGSTSGEPFVLVMLELASAGYPYKLKAHLDSKWMAALPDGFLMCLVQLM
jgi:hypothetical protein